MDRQKPILVTGSHRSGSTWTGKMLSASNEVDYIHEPFLVDVKIGVNPQPFDNWFHYICEENEGNYERIFRHILNFNYPLVENIQKIRTAKNLAKLTRDQFLFLLYKMKKSRPLMKDPIAFFSAEWLYQKFDMDILVLIRHPAAFCSSLKIKDWRFDFHNFLNQPLLIRDYLYPFEKEIRAYTLREHDIIDQSILLWNCIHYTVQKYQQKYPEWLYIRHEDLSRDPVGQFQLVYQKLHLSFSADSQKEIELSSGTHNPHEQTKNEFKRNSQENIMNWKNRLSPEEIEKIRERTAPIANAFYAEEEW